MQTRRGRKGKGKEADRRKIPSDGGGERGSVGSAGEGREGEKDKREKENKYREKKYLEK